MALSHRVGIVSEIILPYVPSKNEILIMVSFLVNFEKSLTWRAIKTRVIQLGH